VLVVEDARAIVACGKADLVEDDPIPGTEGTGKVAIGLIGREVLRGSYLMALVVERDGSLFSAFAFAAEEAGQIDGHAGGDLVLLERNAQAFRPARAVRIVPIVDLARKGVGRVSLLAFDPEPTAGKMDESVVAIRPWLVAVLIVEAKRRHHDHGDAVQLEVHGPSRFVAREVEVRIETIRHLRRSERRGHGLVSNMRAV